jgi:hypothetical protein
MMSVASLALGAQPSYALPQRGHNFAFSFGGAGAGEGELEAPAGVAVAAATGLVYVSDQKHKQMVIYRPSMNAEGELTGEEYVGAASVAKPGLIAVDNSDLGGDPSAGDVYVVSGESRNAIYKLGPQGEALGKLTSFQEAGGKAKVGPVDGLAVDSSGNLVVYREDGAIITFDDALSNQFLSRVQSGAGKATQGLALDSHGNYYVGAEGAAKVPVIAKLQAGTGMVLSGELEQEATSAVALNPSSVPANLLDEQDDAYLANAGSIAQFAPDGSPIQRLQAPGLQAIGGVAVDGHTGAVFATDPTNNQVDVFTLEAPGPPRITVSEQAAPPGNDIQLLAKVDPSGAPTHYFFEYGEASCVTAGVCTKTQNTDAGEGFGDQSESVELRNLPTGVYHYRAIAESSLGRTESPERTFTVLSIFAGLPDGRAWELVTPPDKYGAPVEALTREGGLILAAVDGDALTYVANGAITEEAPANRSPEMQQVLSVRGAGEWNSQDIATPQTEAQGILLGHTPEYRLFSPDLSISLVEPFEPEPMLAAGSSGETMYVRADAPLAPDSSERSLYEQAGANSGYLAPGYLPLITEATAPEASLPVDAVFLDGTADLSHVVFEAGGALTGSSSGAGLYELAGGKVEFVSELPGGGVASESALGYDHVQASAIAADGSRVVWTDSQSRPGHLYMRDVPASSTVQLDRAQGVAEPTTGEAKFQTASADGSRVFFTDTQPLTPGSTAEPTKRLADLYECEMVAQGEGLECELHDLTVSLGSGEHAAVESRLLGASEDGSTVYLAARGRLAENENAAGEQPKAGANNLYELHDEGGVWTTTFIAVLSGADSPDWDEGLNVVPEDTSYQTARVSPNGRFVAFMSQRGLTGYDNEDLSSEKSGERLDEEVFLYDSSAQRLTCVSCDPTGARPTGVLDEEFSGEGLGLLVDRVRAWVGQWLAGSIPGWTAQSISTALVQSRYLNDEGRLFFDSADALVPNVRVRTRREEVKGASESVGVENVYEYEPAGVGGCEGGSGCVGLISSGASANESAFLEATPSGNDVFFLTAAQLLPQDTDTAFDIYDARACTPASPCQSLPSQPAAPCSGVEGCHGGGSSLPGPLSETGSASFSGPGNAVPSSTTQPKQEVRAAKTPTKPLTRAQKLKRALQVCAKRYRRSPKKRSACQASARKRYRPVSAKHAPSKRSASKRAKGHLR